MVEYNPRQWLKVLSRVHGSVLPNLLPRIAITALIGAFATYAHRAYNFKLASTAHTLVGVALGLLLVFRTNASYDRWWEGRKLLGTMLDRSRDLARQAAALIEGDDAEARAARVRVQKLVTAAFALIRHGLRNERDISDVHPLLTDDQRARVERAAARPALPLAWLTEELAANVRAGRLTEQRLFAMDQNITAIVGAWGGTERILRTPVPFAYAHHIKGFLSLFCFSAPFALVDSMRLLTPLVSAIVTYGMFGIEEIGVEIEDPFGYDANDLPVDRMGQIIAANTEELLSAPDSQ